jgi:O-methyltransferase
METIQLLKSILRVIRKYSRSENETDIRYGLRMLLENTYNQDGLLTIHTTDHLKEKLFAESYQLGKATQSWGNSDPQYRAYIACWAARQAVNLEGDFVECGVNRGALSRAIINYVDFPSLNKKFYLVDTYNGLVEKYVSAAERSRGILPGGYAECYEVVKQTFAEFPNVEIIKGIVPEVLPEVKTEKVCYLSIDMNCAEPEIAAAEYFWDKLVKGAIIVLDDYGWERRIAQKEAFDGFAKGKGVDIMVLPTGQGLILKP